MRKINILIVEDDNEDIVKLQKALSTNYFDITAIASNYHNSLHLINKANFDFAIIDIFLNGKPDGISIAQFINQSEFKIPFLFLTSTIDKNVFNRAKVEMPESYLIKPFNRLELLYTIELSIEKFVAKEGAFARNEPLYLRDNFFVKDKHSLVKVSPSEIYYIMVEGQYCNMITEHGKYLINISLHQLMEQLDPSMYIRVHRNYLVNIKWVVRVFPDDNLLVLSNKDSVVLSRKYKTEFLRRHKIFK